MRILDDLHNREARLTGSHDVHVKHPDGLLRMLGDPNVQAAAGLMITHEYNMSQGAEAVDAALSKKASKIFLYPQEDCPNPGPSETTERLAAEFGTSEWPRGDHPA